jgi:hypothetical protein
MPLSGTTSPAIVLSSVDFPEPFGPTMPSAMPGLEGQVDAVERDQTLVAHVSSRARTAAHGTAAQSA